MLECTPKCLDMSPLDLEGLHSNTLLPYGLRTHASKFPIFLSKVSSLVSALLLHKSSVMFATRLLVQYLYHSHILFPLL